MTDRALLQQALEALEWNLPVIEDYGDHEQLNRQHRAITALCKRLAQPDQEPVVKWDASAPLVVHPHPAFQSTPPAQRTWVGLTHEEMCQLQDANWTECEGGGYDWNAFAFARSIEAKLREKNT